MRIDLDKAFDEIKNSKARHKIAIVGPYDKTIMGIVEKACSLELIEPWLVGDKAIIEERLSETSLSKEDVHIVSASNEDMSNRACELIIDNTCEMLMKGNVHTDDLLRAVIKNKLVLPNRRISHVYAIHRENDNPIFISDPSIFIEPNVKDKEYIVDNLISLLHQIGIEKPRIAVLSSVESVNENIKSSVDAETLTKMYEQREDAHIMGPFALDNAVSKIAAATKGLDNEVAGKADALIVPNLDSGNMLCKGLIYIAGMPASGVLCGTSCPIVFTSRSADEDEKMRTLYFTCLQGKLMTN